MSNILIETDEIGDNIRFTCILSKSYITFINCPTCVFLDEIELNWDQPKLVINLLKYSFEDINSKFKKQFRYYVLISEVEYININNWKIVEKNDNKYLLECDLNEAFYNIIEGLLIKN
jgi:hypothetical protein